LKKFVLIFTARHPIKAKPVKTGDAKLWVYRPASWDQDCQAAESHKTIFVLVGLALISQVFLSDGHISQGTPGGTERAKRRKAMFRNFKVLVFVLVILVIAGSAYAFAAQNTIADSAAGYKASVVPGYAVTSIVYDLDATDPTLVDAITFNIAPTSGSAAAALVKLQTASGGAWTDCTLSGAGPSKAATCTYGALQLENVTALNIVASSTTDPAP
jgi:hypothetical protein